MLLFYFHFYRYNHTHTHTYHIPRLADLDFIFQFRWLEVKWRRARERNYFENDAARRLNFLLSVLYKWRCPNSLQKILMKKIEVKWTVFSAKFFETSTVVKAIISTLGIMLWDFLPILREKRFCWHSLLLRPEVSGNRLETQMKSHNVFIASCAHLRGKLGDSLGMLMAHAFIVSSFRVQYTQGKICKFTRHKLTPVQIPEKTLYAAGR